MEKTLLKSFWAWLLLALLAPSTAKAIDSDWGTASVYVGETTTLYMSSAFQSIMDSPYIINVTYNWSSYDNSIAQVTSSSLKACTVKGLKKGTVRINCYLSYVTEMGYGAGVPNYINGYIILTVKEKVPVNRISISPTTVCLAPGDNVQLTAIVYPNNAFDKTVTWSSSDTNVVTVDNTGLLKAIDYGNVTITCSANDGSGVTGICEVTVVDKVPVTSINLSDTQLSLGTERGTSKYLYATILPDNATDKSVTWTSSNPSVASVYDNSLMEDGRYRAWISAKAIGSTTITCIANDGSGVQATCNVNVYKYPDGSHFASNTSEGVSVGYTVLDNTNGTCEVYSVSRDATGTVTIPSVVEGYTVISIGKSACDYRNSITTVNLPSTVTSIGDEAFRGCSSLASMKLNNVTSIGDYAFQYCKTLSSITGVNQLVYIGRCAFSNTPWYDKLPDGSLYLGKVFYQYKGTMTENTSISIKDGTVSITPDAFAKYIIPEYPTTNNNLVSVSIPKSVSCLNSSFSYCTNLEKIVIDPANETYDSRNDCNAAIETGSNTLIGGCKGTVIPETVKAIGNRAFISSGIKSVDIPNSVDSIADYAFYNSDSLISVCIGSNLRYLGSNVFESCGNLETITVSDDNIYYDSRDNCNAIIESQTNRLVVGTHKSTIPYTVKTIGSYAFNTSTNKLKNVRIHDGIETVGDYAFYSQSALTAVTIGRGVKEIGKYAFYCNNLKGVHLLSDTPTELDETTFRLSWNSDKQQYECNATLFVPRGSMINYMTTEGWSNFEKIVEVDDDDLIDGETFTDNTEEGVELTYMVTDVVAKACELVESPTTIEGKVTIPDNPKGYTVTSIGGMVFSGYKAERNITEVVIPDHVKSIGYEAFYNIKTLTSITIPNSVTTIGRLAFGSCRLTSLVIPNSVDSIADVAFANNYSMESLVIGKGLRKMVGNPFHSNTKLKTISVVSDNPYYDSRGNCNAIIEKSTNTLATGCTSTVIPSTVKAIGDNAFYQYGIYTITIPNNVETIGRYAYGRNTSLRSLTIGRNVKRIDKNAFYSCYKLMGIHVLNHTPIEIDETVFGCDDAYPDSIYKTATLFVPIGAKVNYMTSEVWSKFKKIEEIADDAVHAGMVFTADTKEGVTLTFAITDAAAKTCQLFASPTDISGELTIPASPNGYDLTEIGRSTFSGCGMTTVTIPETVRAIQLYAFSSCRELTSVKSLITNPFDINPLAFSNYNSEDKEYYFTDATLYVPIGTKAKYQTAEGWKLFKSIVEVEMDGIEPILVQKGFGQTSPVISLSGQRLTAPRKGINIIGGKKVVVR